MSASDPLPQGSPLAVEPQDEQLPVMKIVVVAVISFAIFGIGIGWAVSIMNSVAEQRQVITGPRQEPTHVGEAEIGIVDQHQFRLDRRAEQLRAQKVERLSGGGWVSRKEGVVHIPINDAMDAVARGRRPGALPPPPQDEEPPLGAAPGVGVDHLGREGRAAPTPAGPGPEGGGRPHQQVP